MEEKDRALTFGIDARRKKRKHLPREEESLTERVTCAQPTTVGTMERGSESRPTTLGMSLGFLSGFLLTGYHAHFLLHLHLGHTLLAMFAFVGAVLAGLMLNLWFMAGQRYVLGPVWRPAAA